MQGFSGTLRSLVWELDLIIQSLSGFGLVILLGFVVAAILLAYTLVRR